jgi:hypothetical protein
MAKIEDDTIKALMRENRVILIHDVLEMKKDTFVGIFKLGGHMHGSVVDAISFIWNKSWNDHMMLSLSVVVSAN